MVRTSTSATSHVVGNYYSYSEAIAGTSYYDYQYIPGASTPQTYDLVCAAEQGVNGFYYLKNTSSGTPSYTTRAIESFSSSSGYIYIKDYSTSTPAFSFKSGYGHPVWAVTGSGTQLFQVTNSDGTFADHKVSTSSTAGGTRYVYLRATEITPHTLHIYFDEHVQSITFTNGDTVTYDPRAPYGISYNYTGDVVIDASQTGWKAGWGNFTGTVYWGTSSGSTAYTIGEYSMGSRTSSGSLSNRTISYTSATDRYIYITASGVTYYTIKMNPNGGTVNGHTSEYTVSSAYEGGTTYVLPVRSQVTPPDGYDLYGFRRGSSTTGDYYAPGASVTIDGNYTFYAVWLAKQYDYKLSFDPNGGHFSDWSTEPKVHESITTATSINVTVISSFIPSRTGYTFLGYGWTKTQTTNLFVEGSTVPLQSSNPVRTLYAIWKVNSYTLSLNGNGGTFGPYVTVKPVEADYGEVIHLSDHKPTRSGYTLLGWNPSSTATEPLYGPDDDYTMIYTDLTWYAVWQKTTFTLTLDANGGRFGILGPTTKTVSAEYGSSVSLSSYSPTRNKYRHTGWQTSGGTTYSTTGSITITGDITLYAVWSRETIAKFYWDGNTGSTDSTLFKQNAKIKTALTAGRWNLFRAKVKEIAEAVGQTFSYTNVSGNSTISARDFTSTRNAINNLPSHGTIPSTKSQGDAVGASLYNGTGSLKDGLNAAIDNYNTTD